MKMLTSLLLLAALNGCCTVGGQGKIPELPPMEYKTITKEQAIALREFDSSIFETIGREINVLKARVERLTNLIRRHNEAIK